MPTCIHTKQYIAKRRHKRTCHYCLLPILPGERVQREFYRDGDYPYSLVTHLVCLDGITESTQDYLFDDPCDEGIPEGILVNGYLDDIDITPEWREWYARRLAQGSRE